MDIFELFFDAPYNIIIKLTTNRTIILTTNQGENKSPEGSTVRANGRTGSPFSPSKAYNGSNTNYFYATPAEFFSSDEINSASVCFRKYNKVNLYLALV